MIQSTKIPDTGEEDTGPPNYLKKTFVPNHACLSGNLGDKRSQKKAIGLVWTTSR